MVKTTVATPVKEIIYESMKKRIVFLDCLPGSVLNIRDLAQEFSTSLTPVREVLIRLEAEGLVSLVPNTTPCVSTLSWSELRNAFEVRLFLADLVAELAVRRVTDEEIASIKAVIETIDHDDALRKLMETDWALHDLINRATKNDDLARMLERCRNRMIRSRFLNMSVTETAGSLTTTFQNAVEALTRRDGEGVQHILKDHLKQFVRDLNVELLGPEASFPKGIG